jgi:hypothetical protein
MIEVWGIPSDGGIRKQIGVAALSICPKDGKE